ncbi:MAG: restriction endonuclease subunit S [Nitrosospira sp.]
MGGHAIPGWWTAAHLSDVSSKIADGSHNPPAKQGSGLPMLSAVNINDNKIIFSDYRLIEEDAFLHEDRRTRIAPNDVLLTIVGAIGRTAVVSQTTPRFTLQRSVAVITPLLIDSKFLMYQFESPRIALHFKKNARGTAQKGVYLKTLGDTVIWLCPLSEQHRIVAKIEELFSELDKGVENLKTAQAQLKVNRQALLKHAFEGKLTAKWREENKDMLETGEALLKHIQTEREQRYRQQLADWEAAGKQGNKPKVLKALSPLPAEKLEELSELPAGWMWAQLEYLITNMDQGWSPKCENSPCAGAEWGVIKTSAIQHGNFVEKENKALPKHLRPKEQHRLVVGDILITRAGPRVRVGVCCLVRSVRENLMNCDKVYRIRSLDILCRPDYIEGILNSPKVLSEVERIKSGINDSGLNLNQGAFLSIAIPYCSPPEQKVVVMELERKLSVLTHLDQTITASLQQAEALRQSILKKAFSGQLVPQDPHDEPASALLARIKTEKSAQSHPKKVRA